ncbi:MAG: aldolase/citrate lyase family protein [Pseudomonadota bacterium]|nr:aldolase/citrate lyase family protein [Pseudomonadota bacterium]
MHEGSDGGTTRRRPQHRARPLCTRRYQEKTGRRQPTNRFCQLNRNRGRIRNIDAIAATKGLDCLWLGHFDLSCSLGIPGEFDHPDFKKTSALVKRAARKHNTALGRLAGTPGETIALHKQGYALLCYSGDLWVYQKALITEIDEIRANCKA